MKELTIEQKAKRYDKALEKARNFELPEYQRIMEELFPELLESEDEKVRKEIISFLQDHIDDINLQVSGDYDTRDKEDIALQEWCKRAIDWLEKQGDLKSDEWKEGDVVRHGGVLALVTNGRRAIKSNLEQITIQYPDEWVKAETKERKYFFDELEKQDKQQPVDKIEPKFKVGDWVVWKDKCYKVNYNGCGYELVDQDGLSTSLEYDTIDENAHIWDVTTDAKAGDVLASELCDSIILFKGIKDYNIDFYCDYDFSKIDIPGDRFSVNNGQHYGNIEDSKDFHPSTKEQRDTLLKAMADAGYTFDFDKKELKKIEKKSQRMVSAEAKEALYNKPTDEEMKELLRTEYEKGRADTIAEMEKNWSEEDEDTLAAIIAIIRKQYNGTNIEEKKYYNVLINWLKSLKDRYTWRPSNEQIDTLEHFVRSIGESGYASPYDNNTKLLYSLLEQLKKLKA